MIYVNIVKLDEYESKRRLAGRIIHAMTGRIEILLAAAGYRYQGGSLNPVGGSFGDELRVIPLVGKLLI
jgi:hypothetical protein